MDHFYKRLFCSFKKTHTHTNVTRVPLSELPPEPASLSVLLALSAVIGASGVDVAAVVISVVSGGSTAVEGVTLDVWFISGAAVVVVLVNSVLLVNSTSPPGAVVGTCVVLVFGAKVVGGKSVRLKKTPGELVVWFLGVSVELDSSPGLVMLTWLKCAGSAVVVFGASVASSCLFVIFSNVED